MVVSKKITFYVLTIFLFFVITGFSLNVQAAEKNYIRVGLYYGNTSENRYELTFDNGVRIAKFYGTEIIGGSQYDDARVLVANFQNGYAEFTLRDKTGTEIRKFDLNDANLIIPLDFEGDGGFKVKDKNYRGAVLFNDLKGTLNLINYIDEEKYLYGVVGNEIGKSAPHEAQKAQAVACRSYSRVKQGTHENYGFDICSTPHCQYYRGKDSESAAVSRAVDDTFGKTIKYNGRTVAAFYSKNSGGYTSASEDIWNERLPYLRAKEDRYSPDFTWKKSFTKREIEAKLVNAGKGVGNLRALRVEERASSGAVKALTFIGDDGSATVEKDKIRTTLGTSDLKSLMFTFDGDFKNVKSAKDVNSQKQSGDVKQSQVYVIGKNGQSSMSISNEVACISSERGIVQSRNFKLANSECISASGRLKLQDVRDNNSSDSNYATNDLYAKIGGSDYISADGDMLFTGLGYGHGVGMAQDGAIEIANRGFGYEDILKYYYDDISVD